MEYNKDNPLKVVTLCSGYDSQCLALERLKSVYPEFNYELVAWSEFDRKQDTFRQAACGSCTQCIVSEMGRKKSW